MAEIIVYSIVFAYTFILWVVVLVVYSALIESLDFGSLGTFAAKSVLLVGIVAVVVTFVPFGGLLALVVWWIGLAAIFRMDFWECRVLVILIWGINFLLGLGISALIRSATSQA
jgi:hypothetical protein